MFAAELLEVSAGGGDFAAVEAAFGQQFLGGAFKGVGDGELDGIEGTGGAQRGGEDALGHGQEEAHGAARRRTQCRHALHAAMGKRHLPRRGAS